MRVLVNERLSEHKFKTPEGYLICTDAILARTGKQTYRRGEVFGLDCKDADSDVEVDRKPEEVFSDATLASFENKPLTVEHPDEDVNVNNHKDYAVGFVRDVKRGKTALGEDVILGTLVVTDAKTIEEIENGEHTDLSCGYDCDIEDEVNPQQRRIRGNHVALCQQGRAGIARIVDSVKDDIIFGFTNADLEKAKEMATKAKDKAEKKLLEDLVAKIKFDLETDKLDNKLNKSINDVEPREGEDKADFISRFMEATKSEYPDVKQRLAVAYSYWEKRHKKDSMKDGHNTKTITWLDDDIYIEYDLDEKKYYLASDDDRFRYRRFETEDQALKYYVWNKKEVRRACLDSIKDKLVEIPQQMLRDFENMLAAKRIKIDSKGKTMFGRIHYQVSSELDFKSFCRALDEINAKMEAKNIPMTFNAGSNGTICTAGIDLDDMYVHDSVKDEELHTGQMYKDKTSTVGGVFTIKKRLGNGKVLIEYASNKAQERMDINDLMSKIRNNKVELIDSIKEDKDHYDIVRIKNGKIYSPPVADAYGLAAAKDLLRRWNNAYGGGYTIVYHGTKQEIPYETYDSLKKYNVYYKDEDGNNCIKVIKASSLEDAIKKVK